MSLYSLSLSALLLGLSAAPGDTDDFSQSAAARCRPDVSVVIAAHNAEAYIGETIESILAQEGISCEILVMDDGSRDRTGEVVKSFGSKVKYRYAPPSGGPSKPRNLGVQLATGEFVATFDADDVMLPGKLKAQIDALRAHPEIPCVVADYRNFSEDGPEPITHFDTCDVLRATMGDGGELVVLPASRARDVLTQENFSITGSLVFRRTAMLELQGFDHRLCPAAEDFDLTYRCALSYPIGVLRQVGFNRRLHVDNASKDSSRVLIRKARTRQKLADLETDSAPPQPPETRRERLSTEPRRRARATWPDPRERQGHVHHAGHAATPDARGCARRRVARARTCREGLAGPVGDDTVSRTPRVRVVIATDVSAHGQACEDIGKPGIR